MRINRMIIITTIALLSWLGTICGQEIHVGDSGVFLRAMGDEMRAPVCVDRDALDQYMTASIRSDPVTIARLLKARRIFLIDVGTEVAVTMFYGEGDDVAHIRVMGGEFEGRRGYVRTAWLGKLN